MMYEQTLNEIINVHPETKLLMDHYKINYVEGAMDTFEEAALIMGLSVTVLGSEFDHLIGLA